MNQSLAFLRRDIQASRNVAAVHGNAAVRLIRLAAQPASSPDLDAVAVTHAREAGRYANDVLALEESAAHLRRRAS
jgi:hypothetical protein